MNTESCESELERLIASKNFSTRFRPVTSLKSRQIFGHLARAYAPPDSPVRDMARYFAMAREQNLVEKLCSRYFEAILKRFKSTDVEGNLLLPLPFAGLEQLGEKITEPMEKILAKHEIPAQRITLLYPDAFSAQPLGHTSIKNLAKGLRRLGFELAAPGIGCALDRNLVPGGWKPGLLLLDENHFEDMDINTTGFDALRDLIRYETGQGRRVLAQGINTLSQFNLIRELGIELAAGDFIGKFSSSPYEMMPAAAYQAIHKNGGSAGRAQQESGHLVDRLLVRRPPVAPDTPSEQVFQIFESEQELRAIVVVCDDRPVGLISRYGLIDRMSRPFSHELYGRRPCERFMDTEPLIMDVGISLAELTDMVIRADPRHLVSGFIVTEQGRYLGTGAVQDLVREITAMQMEAAKYANPLTQLPGNTPINQKIDNLLGEQVMFCVAYCDLDHFKPFNDVYGYAKGDEIILLTARILSETIEPERDFLGHIGGDDFVLIFRSDDFMERCEHALQRFKEEITAFFSPGDIEQGGYLTTNRKGETEFCPLTSLSIGAVQIEPGCHANHLAVATVAAEVKKRAKSIPGNSFYLNQRKKCMSGDEETQVPG